MKIILLTFSIFLLSFIFVDSSTSQSNKSEITYEEIIAFPPTEFNMYLHQLNSDTKLLYGDILTFGIELEISTLNETKASSWEDIKTEILNEIDSTKKD